MKDDTRGPVEGELIRAIEAKAPESEQGDPAFLDMCRTLVWYIMRHADEGEFEEVLRDTLNEHILPKKRRATYSPVIGYLFNQHKIYGFRKKRNKQQRKPTKPGMGPQGEFNL